MPVHDGGAKLARGAPEWERCALRIRRDAIPLRAAAILPLVARIRRAASGEASKRKETATAAVGRAQHRIAG
jgi:hypothetical protein